MQAHSQSNPAARNHASPHPSGPPAQTPHPSARGVAGHFGRAQPQLRAPVTRSRDPDDPTSIAGRAGLAHDAGNLLGALELYCNLLSLPGVLQPQHSHYATELSLISERSSELIRRLLALLTSSSPGQPASNGAAPSATDTSRRDPSACNAAVTSDPVHAHTLRHLTPVLQGITAGAASVRVNCPASLPPVNIPSEIVERITINLVRNAAQAIQAQQAGARSNQRLAAPLTRPAEIRVALATNAGRLRLTIEDNGPGLPQSLVDEFLRPSPLPPGVNHGLGHRIVHELATGSGGQISIRVRPGRGTLFTIAWPLPHVRPHLDSPSNLPQAVPQRGFSTC